jgi:hypothetical protein
MAPTGATKLIATNRTVAVMKSFFSVDMTTPFFQSSLGHFGVETCCMLNPVYLGLAWGNRVAANRATGMPICRFLQKLLQLI